MHPALPDNYSLSYSRLASLITCLRKTPAVLREYDSVIRDQESKGIIENVGVEPPGKVHYLPHREVVRSDKQTTKLRIVFDASSKKNIFIFINAWGQCFGKSFINIRLFCQLLQLLPIADGHYDEIPLF